jgi:uncharacterized protein YbbK (DUF523 family)
MRVLVSACLLGRNCKYNGGNNRCPRVESFVADKQVVEICPEMMAGLGTPRTPIEIVNGVLVDKNGRNVDAALRDAAARALELAEKEQIDLAILQSRSPTCGVNQVYDGTFSGRLIPGQGVFARMLMDAGFAVRAAEDI